MGGPQRTSETWNAAVSKRGGEYVRSDAPTDLLSQRLLNFNLNFILNLSTPINFILNLNFILNILFISGSARAAEPLNRS